jgi:hypothetical protein
MRRNGRVSTTNRRRAAAVALVVTGIAGLGIASAAQLGLRTASLGAGNEVVASCQPDSTPIGVSFTTGLSGGQYAVKGVTLTDVACNGQAVRLSLTSGGEEIGTEIVGTVKPGTNAYTFTTAIPAADVDGVAVVIHS